MPRNPPADKICVERVRELTEQLRDVVGRLDSQVPNITLSRRVLDALVDLEDAARDFAQNVDKL
jgi:hypothetical protein